MISQLEQQEEQYEAEVESLAASGSTGRMGELEETIETHAHHREDLEKTLRALDNEQLDPEFTLETIKDGLDYYLESNQDADFYNDDEIFEPLALGELEQKKQQKADGKKVATDRAAAELLAGPCSAMSRVLYTQVL